MFVDFLALAGNGFGVWQERDAFSFLSGTGRDLAAGTAEVQDVLFHKTFM